MSTATAPAIPDAPTDAPTDAPVDARTARHLRMLERLSEIGMELAEAIGREALAEPGEGEVRRSAGDRGPVFARVARAVRQTVALEARLANDAQTREARLGQAERADRQAETRRARARREAEVRDIVQTVIEAETSDCVHSSFRGALDARLDREDDDSDLADLPLGEAVARVCRDLGLDPDWSDWDADWAGEALEAADRRPRRWSDDPTAPVMAWPGDAATEDPGRDQPP